MKHFWFAVLVLLCAIPSHGQKSKTITIGFYNVENLFDTINNPYKNDEEFLPSSKKKWNTERYDFKLNQISRVIHEMAGENGPDILGLCEVENKKVVEDLTQMPLLRSKGYGVIHFESPDERGIDVALLYKKKLFDIYTAYPVKVKLGGAKKDYTRDILVCGFIHQKKGDTIWVMVNHFPSRSGGQAISEPKRIQAAQTLRSIADSILTQNYLAKIIAIGDFNDEYLDTSLRYILRSGIKKNQLNYSDFFNPVGLLKQEGFGTIMYKGEYELIDQIFLSYGLFNTGSIPAYKESSAQIFAPDWLKQQEGKYKGAPFRYYAGDKYLGGYSDHFPVLLQIGY